MFFYKDGISLELLLIGLSCLAGWQLSMRLRLYVDKKGVSTIRPSISIILLAILVVSVSLAFFFRSYVGLVNTGVLLLLLNQIHFISINNHRKGILAILREGVIILSPSGQVEYVNPAAERLLGKTMEQIKSTSFSHNHSGLERTIHETINSKTSRTKLLKLDGIFILLSIASGKEAANWGVKKGFILQMEDVTEYIDHTKKEGEKTLLLEEVQGLIYYDHLTDLLNRRFFDEKMPEVLIKSMADKSHLSILMIDIDQFKEINDKYGHQAGDLALKFVAGSMKSNSRKDDLVFRLGGDEFALVLMNTPKKTAMIRAQHLCKEICEAGINTATGATVKMTLSIGVATFPAQAVTLEDLLLLSDLALYHAKAEGRNCVRFYTPPFTGS